MKKFKVKSFCKINLSLRVLKRLCDGYHNIKSLITFCDLHDVILIRKIKGLNDKISFSGRFKNGINKKSNTITKVLYLLRKRKFFKKQAFKINIEKNIPHGSGLGGGSSNAADVLNFFISKRIKQGYGLNQANYQYLPEKNPELVSTVDQGITSAREDNSQNDEGKKKNVTHEK